MQTLRRGDAGPEVIALQKKLGEAGHGLIAGRRLITDGRFGRDTDIAVRQLQRERGLLPDGVAGPGTWEALNSPARNGSFPFGYLIYLIGGLGMQAALRARSLPAFGGLASSPVHRKTSEQGIAFIYKEEARPNVSNVLHWPGGDNSGVTLGPGYDMGGRTSSEISADLQAIGVSREVADKVQGRRSQGPAGPAVRQGQCQLD